MSLIEISVLSMSTSSVVQSSEYQPDAWGLGGCFANLHGSPSCFTVIVSLPACHLMWLVHTNRAGKFDLVSKTQQQHDGLHKWEVKRCLLIVWINTRVFEWVGSSPNLSISDLMESWLLINNGFKYFMGSPNLRIDPNSLFLRLLGSSESTFSKPQNHVACLPNDALEQ